MSNVQIQEDRWQIQQLMARYCETADQHDWDAMDQVFTEGTVGVYNGMEVVSLALLVSQGKKNMTRDTVGRTQHNVSNFRIELEGDTASCVTNYYAVHYGAGPFKGQLYSMWGEYRDQLVRTDKGWRINRRDYTTFFTEGDDRMVFAGEEPEWNESKQF